MLKNDEVICDKIDQKQFIPYQQVKKKVEDKEIVLQIVLIGISNLLTSKFGKEIENL